MHRFAKVSTVTFLSTIITLLSQIISVPVCLHYWGNGLYGEWLAVMAAVVMIRTIDGGYVWYIGNKLNVLYNSDHDELRLTLASSAWGIALLGLIQILLVLFAYYFSSVRSILGLNLNFDNKDIFLGLIILIVSWAFSGSYIGILHRFLTPVGRMYDQAWWMMSYQVGLFIAVIVSASLRLSLLDACIFVALVQFFIYIASAIYIKIKLPEYYPWLKNANLKIGLQDLIKSIPLTIGSMLQQLSNSALVILVSSTLGFALVPLFTSIRTISNLWNTMITIISTPLLPDIVRYQAQGDGDKLLKVHEVYLLLLALLVDLSIMILYPFLRFIFNSWTGKHLIFDNRLISILLAAIVVYGITSLIYTLLSGINNSRYILVTTAMRGLISLVLGVIFLHYMGLSGLGFAIFIAEIMILFVTIFYFFYPLMSKMGVDFKESSFFNWLLLPPLSVVIYLITQYLGANVFNITFILSFLGIIIGIIMGVMNLDHEVRSKLKSFLIFK